MERIVIDGCFIGLVGNWWINEKGQLTMNQNRVITCIFQASDNVLYARWEYLNN